MFMFCSWCRGEIPSLTLCFASSTTCLAQRPINGRPERVERTYTSRGLYPQTPPTPRLVSHSTVEPRRLHARGDRSSYPSWPKRASANPIAAVCYPAKKKIHNLALPSGP